jgi:hypothetical protein
MWQLAARLSCAAHNTIPVLPGESARLGRGPSVPFISVATRGAASPCRRGWRPSPTAATLLVLEWAVRGRDVGAGLLGHKRTREPVAAAGSLFRA